MYGVYYSQALLTIRKILENDKEIEKDKTCEKK